jgi:hypothetical protein
MGFRRSKICWGSVKWIRLAEEPLSTGKSRSYRQGDIVSEEDRIVLIFWVAILAVHLTGDQGALFQKKTGLDGKGRVRDDHIRS